MSTQVRAFRAPDRLWDAVTTAAEGLGVNRSELLRQAMAAYGPIQRIVMRQEPATPGSA